jgi:hypothetical protein
MAQDSVSAVSLWRLVTKASLLECTLAPVAANWCELRLSQDNEVVLRERFPSSAAASEYAALLQRRCSDLAPSLTSNNQRKATH